MSNSTLSLTEIKKGKTGKGILIENDGYITLVEGKNNKMIKEAFENADDWYVPKPFIVDAVFQKADIKNANERVYPRKTLEREVAKYQQRIKDKNALGECNHPESSTIDLGRVSHNIIELHWEGNTVIGKMELNISEGFKKYGICSTLGDTVANLLLNGYLIGVSSRAVGSVENRMGTMVVGDDLEIICWDVVCDNSTPGAKISINGPDELQQYVESNETKKKKPQLSEKLQKIENILNS